MPVILIGGSPSTPVEAQARRYHITWCVTLASVAPDGLISTHSLAVAVHEALPSLGLVPVSPIAAITGDPFIQFTVQIGTTGPGADIQTIADIIEAADKLPWISPTGSPRLSLDVCEIEVRQSSFPGGNAAAIILAQNTVARQRAVDRAKASDVVTKAGDVVGDIAGGAGDAVRSLGDKVDEYAKKLFGGLADVAKFALGMAAIVGIVYVVARYRK